MTNAEKRILLNQREIMYTLQQLLLEDNNIPTKILKVANGLGKACVLTNQVLESEVKDD